MVCQMPYTPPKKTEPNRHLMTVKDVALLDNCSEKTVRRAIDAGLLEVMRVGPGGRLIRIDPRSHNAYRMLN
jgi:excisionase family DNA binding protein